MGKRKAAAAVAKESVALLGQSHALVTASNATDCLGCGFGTYARACTPLKQATVRDQPLEHKSARPTLTRAPRRARAACCRAAPTRRVGCAPKEDYVRW